MLAHLPYNVVKTEGVLLMKATDVLMEEHQLIEHVLSALEKAAGRLGRGEEVYLRFFIGVTVFIKGFADGCHHSKEEGLLFPALVENGLSKESGPVAVMLAEHVQARQLTQMLREMTERLQSGDERARDKVVQSAMGYVRLLRQHIYKEDNILFPMADKVIPLDRQQQLYEAFRQTERDELGEVLSEKYHALAQRLVDESIR